MIEPATPALVCVAVSTPTMKMRCELLPLMVKPLPLMLTERRPAYESAWSITLPSASILRSAGVTVSELVTPASGTNLGSKMPMNPPRRPSATFGSKLNPWRSPPGRSTRTR